MINKVCPQKKYKSKKWVVMAPKRNLSLLPPNHPIHPQHKKKTKMKKNHFISRCVVVVVVFLVPTSKLLLTEPNPRLNKS